MKKMILAAVFAALSIPVIAAPVAARVSTPVRVSAPVRAPAPVVKSVAPIKSVTPIKAAPNVTKPDHIVMPASKVATPPVATTTATTAALVAFNRLCDPAAPEQVAGRTRVPDYTNVFFK